MDKIGPMAQSASDCALVFDAIAGQDKDDPTTQGYRVRRRRRVAKTAGILAPDSQDAPEVGKALDEVERVFKGMGVACSQVRLPERDYTMLCQVLMEGEVAGALEAFIRGPGLGQLVDKDQRAGLRKYLQRTLGEYARAVQERLIAVQEIRALFGTIDVLVASTCRMEPPKIDARLLEIPPLSGRPIVLGAVAGLPGITVPMGTGGNALPIGLTITGDIGEDRTVLGTAIEFQRHTEWHLARPRMEHPS